MTISQTKPQSLIVAGNALSAHGRRRLGCEASCSPTAVLRRPSQAPAPINPMRSKFRMLKSGGT